MSRLKILLASLICSLIISLAFNIILAWELMENRDLSQAYDQLRQSYDELKEIYLLPEPPISKSQAIDIALRCGGWNETSLQGMKVSATLDFIVFRTGPDYVEFLYLHQVTGHVSDYRPREICQNGTCTTFRYIWVVSVTEADHIVLIPPPGLYYVDPVTGEVTSSNDIILGKTP